MPGEYGNARPQILEYLWILSVAQHIVKALDGVHVIQLHVALWGVGAVASKICPPLCLLAKELLNKTQKVTLEKVSKLIKE
jgi:antitoxin component HigA of HigAB toxin-antitoxin module